MSDTFSLARAGRWLLNSGIQEPSGGVARFYDSAIRKNKAVSTEITGYTASALVYLYKVTGDERYLDRARQTAAFLADHAWDHALRTFPFEHPSPSDESNHLAFFFDCGIIVRGLAAVWRQTKEDRLLDIAHQAAHGMLRDFHAGPDYHPILELPVKQPAERTDQWSRHSGCYQLKSALAWLEIAEATGDSALRAAYDEMVDFAISVHKGFPEGVGLPLGAITSHRRMDRLHPYTYFLEGLTPVLDRPDAVEAYGIGLSEIGRQFRELAPCFMRADVCAQLLRARIYAEKLAGPDILPVDRTAAAEEADILASFQSSSEDPRLDGGFVFGRNDGRMSSHVSPVPTVFALQALEMWRGYQAGDAPPCRQILI